MELQGEELVTLRFYVGFGEVFTICNATSGFVFYTESSVGLNRMLMPYVFGS